MKVSLRLIISIFGIAVLVISVAVSLSIAVSSSQAAAKDLAEQYIEVAGDLGVKSVMRPFQFAAETVYAMQRRTSYVTRPMPFYSEVMNTTSLEEWRKEWSDALFQQLLGSNFTVGVLNGMADGTHVEAAFYDDDHFYDEVVWQLGNGSAQGYDRVRSKSTLAVVEEVHSMKEYDPRQRPWYGAGAARNLTWTPTFLSLAPYTVIAVGVCGAMYNNNRLMGVNVMALTLDKMSDTLRQTIPHESVKMVITAADNYLLASSYDTPISVETEIPVDFAGPYDEDHCVQSDPGAVRSILSCQTDVQHYSALPDAVGAYVASVPVSSTTNTKEVIQSGGRDYVVSIVALNTRLSDTGRIVPNMNWRLVTIVDLDIVTQKVRAGRDLSIIAAAVICAVVIPLLVLATHLFLAPLSVMVAQVAKSARGEPVAVEPVDSMFTELSILAVAQESAAKNVRAVGDAPKEGVVSLIFTDIESSTMLWGNVSDSMAVSLELHHSQIREAIRAHHGYEVKTVGDSFMIAVKDPLDAAKLAIEIQDRMMTTPFPKAIELAYAAKSDPSLLGSIDDNPESLTTPSMDKAWNGIRVRIGIHLGAPDITFDEVAKGYDYYGPCVNVAARVESVGHGGQIVVSETFRDAVASRDPSLTWKFLGSPSLKGVSEPVKLYQLNTRSSALRTFPGLEVPAITEEFVEHDRSSTKSRRTVGQWDKYAELTGDALVVARTWDALSKFLPPALKQEMTAKLCKSWRLDTTSISSLARRAAGAATHDVHSRPASRRPSIRPEGSSDNNSAVPGMMLSTPS